MVEYGTEHWTPSKQKLIANLHPNKYIALLPVLLRWILANGFRVTKIHRDFQFHQKPYMKTLIDTFNSKRSEVKAKIGIESFKLILISAIGKIYEGVHNKSRDNVVTYPKECVWVIADLNFTLFTIIESNMVLLHRKTGMQFQIKVLPLAVPILKKQILSKHYCNVCWL